MKRTYLSPVSRWALGLVVFHAACAHPAARLSPSPEATLSQARESAQHEARINKLEADLLALVARVQTLQAQAHALREAGETKGGLPYERWQPTSLERLARPTERAITGQGDAVKLSVQQARVRQR